MQIPASSQPYMFIPVTGPAGVDLTQYTGKVALRPDDGSEPVPADWKAAIWLAPSTSAAPELALLIHPGDYAPGLYFAWAQLAAGPELLVLPSGRVRVGDTRT